MTNPYITLNGLPVHPTDLPWIRAFAAHYECCMKSSSPSTASLYQQSHAEYLEAIEKLERIARKDENT